MRNTNQKLKVLEHLRSVKTHPTAEQVYIEVRKDLPAITLATVYRNLNQMAERREILRLEINKEYHYDGDTCCHQHCVCNKCGKIIDLFQENISKNALKKLDCKEFNAECVIVIFNGVCKGCKKRGFEK
jgi:Fe2+ or Zn2+ uptake regulation protein